MTHYAPVGGVRDRAKARIRGDIVAASLKLFQERGFDAVTTQEIAAEAGVTQRTLFRYFARKDLILFKADYDYVGRFEAYLNEAMPRWPDPFDAVKAAFLALAAYYDDNRSAVSLIYGLIQNSVHLKAIEQGRQHRIDLLVASAFDGAEAYRALRDPPSLASRIAAAALFGTIRPVQRAWLKGELPGPLVPYAEAGWARVRPVYEAARTYGEGFIPMSQD
jgi:AcrR family transcriptional regulator